MNTSNNIENYRNDKINKLKELFRKGLLFERQTESATNAKKLIDIYIYIYKQARTIYEIDAISNLIKGQQEGFNFQRVPTITNDVITILEPHPKYQKKKDIAPDHHKVIICDNTIEKEHWE
jgi:hypothetical protein